MTGARRVFRPAAVGPRAAVLILRHAGPELAKTAEQYARHVGAESRQGGLELRAALAQLEDAAAEWRERRRDDDYETTNLRSRADSAESGAVPLLVADIAARFGVTEQRVRELARDPSSGLVGERTSGRGRPWVFAPADVEAFEASRER